MLAFSAEMGRSLAASPGADHFYHDFAARTVTAMLATCSELPSKLISAANGIDYSYRDTGGSGSRWSCSSTSAETSTTGIPRRTPS